MAPSQSGEPMLPVPEVTTPVLDRNPASRTATCTPSGRGRITRRMALTVPDELLSAPLASAEFLVVDTETNGLAGDDCEMTEVGAVLVGGGELHDRWSSLCRTSAPLRRGIQRFTGITQAMVDSAPSLEDVVPTLAELLQGRVMVAHNAPFDRRVLRQAFTRIGRDWPHPPVICTAALARAMLPLQRKRGLGVLADALGIEVDLAHRALADAETCARVLCALFPRLCAHAPTVGDALTVLAPRRRPRTGRAARARDPRLGRATAPWTPLAATASAGSGTGLTPTVAAGVSPAPAIWERPRAPELGELPTDPGVYIFRDRRGEVLYVGKSVSIRSRARALRPVLAARRLDRARGGRRLPHDDVRARRARAGEPADQAVPAARQHAARP